MCGAGLRARERAEVDGFTLEASDLVITRSPREGTVVATEASADSAAFDVADETTAFRRTGTGLDHEAARLIATAAFSQPVGESRVVESGAEAIAVRTETIIAAQGNELAETAQLLRNFDRAAIQQDVLNTLAGDLSQTHDLQIRLGGVQQLLGGNR